MKRVIFNQKGGVGKTSVTCNLAAALARQGRKTLVVDLDSQANSSRYLMGDEALEVTGTVADFFASTLSFRLLKSGLREVMYSTPIANLWVVPAERSLGELQPKLEARYKVFKLKQAIDEAIEEHGFDEVLFDTPPALNFYSMSALMASERVLVPFDCDAFSADALVQVQETVEEVAADHNSELELEGIVVNQFQAQARLPQQAIDALLMQGLPVLSPFLSASVAMRESHGKHLPLVCMRPQHKLAKEFQDLADRLVSGDAQVDPATRLAPIERADSTVSIEE